MTELCAAVVLCTYNGERFLPQQLDSLRRQTRQPECYVLSDDASDDASFALLQDFAADRMAAGCRVILHRNVENLGYVRHFSAALQRAEADVLFPCDQDDVWHPEKIARMLPHFVARPALWVLHADARLVDAAGMPLGRQLFAELEVARAELAAMHGGDAFHVLLRRNIVTGAVMALRRDLLARALPVGDGWAHDEWLAMLACLHGEVDTLEEILIDYRQHDSNQIGVQARSPLQRHLGIGVGRRAFLDRLSARQAVLHAHLCAASDVPAERLAEIAARLRHARLRAGLSAHFLTRMRQVLGEWQRGGYARYGSGLRSALSDCLRLD